MRTRELITRISTSTPLTHVLYGVTVSEAVPPNYVIDIVCTDRRSRGQHDMRTPRLSNVYVHECPCVAIPILLVSARAEGSDGQLASLPTVRARVS